LQDPDFLKDHSPPLHSNQHDIRFLQERKRIEKVVFYSLKRQFNTIPTEKISLKKIFIVKKKLFKDFDEILLKKESCFVAEMVRQSSKTLGVKKDEKHSFYLDN